MRVILAALADGVNVSNTGKMNILGVFSSISALTTPAVHPVFYLGAILRPEEDEKGTTHSFHLVIRDSDSHPIYSTQPATIAVPEAPAGTRLDLNLVICLNGVRFPAFGDYEVEFVSHELRHAISLAVQPMVRPDQRP